MNLKYILTNIFYGIVIGVAEIVPGVSGTALALALGIYDELIKLLHTVANFIEAVVLFVLRRQTFMGVKAAFAAIPLRFAVLLAVGTVIAFIALANILDVALSQYPQYMFAIFFGLIVAAILIPARELKWANLRTGLIVIATAVVMFWLVGIDFPRAENGIPSPLLMFAGGLLGIVGMILPGVSGGFILLILGIYQYLLTDVAKGLFKLDVSGTDIFNLGVFGVGLVIGFVLFSKLMYWGLKTHRQTVLAILVGLMLGSLRALWPFMAVEQAGELSDVSLLPKVAPWERPTSEIVLILICMVLAAGVVLALEWVESKQHKHLL